MTRSKHNACLEAKADAVTQPQTGRLVDGGTELQGSDQPRVLQVVDEQRVYEPVLSHRLYHQWTLVSQQRYYSRDVHLLHTQPHSGSSPHSANSEHQPSKLCFSCHSISRSHGGLCQVREERSVERIKACVAELSFVTGHSSPCDSPEAVGNSAETLQTI